ncbi:MAG: HDIG domain-containing protein [Methanomassiliicoccales archaeon]|nr:HDIG domain-containing protein [Methanomassiliicoccales archaeon]NYT16202.1 HDIG domain-containing protein [Methanomassiliicoccales archaeon]
MKAIPSEKECLRFLKEAGCSGKVIRHCCVVSAAAALLADRCGADVELVRAGALLHDIGRSRTHGIGHVAASAEIARSIGLPDPVVRIIQRHIGAGLLKDEVEALDLPDGDYLPVTIEEKIVCHSDNLIDGDEITTLEDSVAFFESKGLFEAAKRMKAMSEEITALVGKRPDILLMEADPSSGLRGPCSAYVSPRYTRP